VRTLRVGDWVRVARRLSGQTSPGFPLGHVGRLETVGALWTPRGPLCAVAGTGWPVWMHELDPAPPDDPT
jgi:hypothetical protein